MNALGDESSAIARSPTTRDCAKENPYEGLWLFHQTGEPNRVLKLEEMSVPIPEAGEVLVRVLFSPISPSDLPLVRGRVTAISLAAGESGRRRRWRYRGNWSCFSPTVQSNRS